MSRQEQQAAELSRVINERFRGDASQWNQFRARYLTTKGEAIANQIQPYMSEQETLAICHQALKAGY